MQIKLCEMSGGLSCMTPWDVRLFRDFVHLQQGLLWMMLWSRQKEFRTLDLAIPDMQLKTLIILPLHL